MLASHTTSPARRSSESRFAGITAVLVFAATLPRLLLHEMWRDEVWLWLVAIESRSLGDLFGELSRSGQGYLFPLLVWTASAFTHSPVALQVVNLAVVTAGAFVFARWAPFPRTVRVLFLLGFLPFYEYAVLSRHYALGALLAWVACAAAGWRRPALWMGIALGLLCQTTVYGVILAAAIVAGWSFDRLRQGASARATPRRDLLVGGAIAGAGAIAGLVQLAPASGTGFARGWRLFVWAPGVFERVLQWTWKGMFPLPEPRLDFWNSNLLEAWPLAMAVAGPLALAGAVALLWPRRAAVVTFVVGAAGLGTFAYAKYVGYVRHGGHLWLLLFAALWIGGGIVESERGCRWRYPLLVALLVLHAVAALVASTIDLARPFSGGPEAAQLIRKHGLDHLPVIGKNDPSSATVALALGRPLYSPTRRIFTTHPDWGPARRTASDEELRCSARELAARFGGEVVLAVTRNLPPWPEVELVARTRPVIERSERFRIYRFRLDRVPGVDDAGCAVMTGR